MKFAYKFNNLLGTVFKHGNLLFTNDGNSVISPVGNRITIFDLKNNKSSTLSLESNYDYTAMDISPNGCLLVAVNEKGEAEMISMVSQTVIHRYKFSGPVKCLKFSPNGEYFAACHKHMVFIFKTPGYNTTTFNSFVVERVYYGSFDMTTWLDWSSDSKILAIGSKDNSVKIYAVKLVNNFRPYILTGHTDEIVGCFFEDNKLDINTVSRNGQLCIWECSINLEDITFKTDDDEASSEATAAKRGKVTAQSADVDSDDDIDLSKALEKASIEKSTNEKEIFMNPKELERDSQGKKIVEKVAHPFNYKRLARHYLSNEPRKEDNNAVLTAAAYHKKLKILITSFSTGAFYLYEIPDVNLIHSLSISEHRIDSVCFNNTGDWLALGVSGIGQLLVWEWQSEQYILKQQGHSSEMTCVAYSPDGQYICTGGEDGRIKLWNMSSGFCFVTFTEHTSAVTGIQFNSNKNFLVSCSLDGTVRAFDIIRYRNFRTFTSPRPVQFACVALDHSGELVAAGGQDVFEIYLWSIKFGRLLEVLSGHEGPVVSVAFAPCITSSTMVSASWDKTIKIWDCLETSSAHETIDVFADAVCVAFKPNGEDVAVATLNGNISIFNIKKNEQIATIEGRNDLSSGVAETDLTTAKTNLSGRCFTSICFSSDGECILAGGRSKNICIYNVKEGILLKKFPITQNHSLDGLNEFINHRNVTDFGNKALVEERDELEGGNVAIRLPGVQKGDMAARAYKPEINVFSVKFSPTGQSWAAATTEGLMLYSLNKGIVFDPFNLSIEVTPKATRELVARQEYSAALIMALKLNEHVLINEILEQIPYADIDLVVLSLPEEYGQRAIQFITKMLATSPHIQYYLQWANTLLNTYGSSQNVVNQQILINLHQVLNSKYEILNKVCDFNKYTIKVLREMAKVKAAANNMEYTNDELMLMQTGSPNNDFEDDYGSLSSEE